MTLVRLEDRQQYLGVDMMNVYYYNTTQDPIDIDHLAQLGSQFQANVMTAVRDTQVDALEHTDIYMTEVGGDLELTVPLAGQTGNNSGDPLPQFTAWYFKLNRSTKLTRNGRKAIGGLSETNLTNGVPVGNILAELDSCELAFALPLVDAGDGTTWYPSIVRFENGVPTAANTITTATFRYVSTQNSRKNRI